MTSTSKNIWLLRAILLVTISISAIYVIYFHISQINNRWWLNKTVAFSRSLLSFGNGSIYLNDLFKTSVILVPVNDTSKLSRSSKMCSSAWYKGLDLEFSAFGADNFRKVIFLMDSYYVPHIMDHFYKCLFYEVGTNTMIPATGVVRFGGKRKYDLQNHTLILQCTIPPKAVNPDMSSITFSLIAGVDGSDMVNITICRSYTSSFDFINSRLHLGNASESKLNRPRKTEKSTLIAVCTQTAHHYDKFPIWLDYHQTLGVGHFYIYDHARSNETRLHRTLRNYIDADIITIIPWHIDQWRGFKHSSNLWITHQIWSQNDCLRRFGHLHSWMLISDVDEYVVPMGTYRDFKEILAVVPPDYCALQVLHYFFTTLHNRSGGVAPADRPRKFVHRRRLLEGRDSSSKNFVRPQMIYYFAVHQVVKAARQAPILYGNVHKHVRLQHYQGPEISTSEQRKFVIDTAIWPFLDRMTTKTTNSSLSTILKS